MPTPSKPPVRNNFFLALGSYLILIKVRRFCIRDLRPTVGLSETHASFSTKTMGSASGSKHETPMHLLRHNATHIVVRSMGSRCWFRNNVMWGFTKIVQDGFEGSWGSWNYLLFEGIARPLLEVLKCCIQRNFSRDLRKAQKKSGNAKLSMVLVYTSSKAAKKVASKKSHQAWNGEIERIDGEQTQPSERTDDLQIWNLLFYVAISGFHVLMILG